MRFINRQNEIKLIKEAKVSSKHKLYTLLIAGNRRIGKTRLVLECLKENDLYFFVNKDTLASELLREYEDLLKAKNILTELESLKNWDDFIKIIIARFKGTIVFDEFQNFREIDASIFGKFQKYLDLNENKKNLLFIFLGSHIGLIRKTFEDKKSPLYGRIKRKLTIKPLSFKHIIDFCYQLKISNFEDIITLYSLFGGYPKYFTSIEDERLLSTSAKTIIDRFFLSENALLEDEVMNILSMEFGKRRGLYYEILSAISAGNTTQSNIASFLNKKQTSISRQFHELVRYFDIIGYDKQLFGNKKLCRIRHPLISFWFTLFYRNLSNYTQRSDLFFDNFNQRFNEFLGKQFEHICSEILQDMNEKNKLPVKLTQIAKHWGHTKETGQRISYEIDIAGSNIKENKVLLCECKWKNKVNAKQILKKLQHNAQLLNLPKTNFHFAIFAKSFAHKTPQALCIDLNDISRFYRVY